MRSTLIAATLLLAAAAEVRSAAPAPIFYEPFEDNQSVLDNGAQPGAAGMPVFVTGVIGRAADFSAGKLLCYSADGRFSAAAGTLEFWLKRPDQNRLGLFDLGILGRANSWGVFFNRDHVIMEVKDSANRFDQAWAPAPTAFDDDWHFVTAVWEQEGVVTRFKVCVDGACKSDYDGIEDHSNPNTAGSICTGWSGFYGFSESVIDELKIYDYVKSDAEILDAYLQSRPDGGPPVITLLGEPSVVLGIGEIYVEAGAKGDDDKDGDVSDRIRISGSVDTSRASTYRVAYNVMDAAGNPAREALRWVHVIDRSTAPPDRGLEYLADRMDAANLRFYVYSDFLAGGNHAAACGWMGDHTRITLNPAWQSNCSSGQTCIRNDYRAETPTWAGVRWLQPDCNWGEEASAGYDLQGGTKVCFNVRGETGKEFVEFFAGGVPGSHGDSIDPERSTGPIALSTQWEQVCIDLIGSDLSHVISPFGWIVRQNAAFYIDDIWIDLARPDALRFFPSYEIPDEVSEPYLVNTAFIYDINLVILAFLSRGTPDDHSRAGLLADAIVFAVNNDRSCLDCRHRNAVMSGDVAEPTPGTQRIPGWWDLMAAMWFEDRFAVSTHTGNVTWSIISLLSMYEVTRKQEYVETAKCIGEWIEANTREEDTLGGYSAGVDGWEATQTNPAGPVKLTYKATEHNIDLVAAFERLYLATDDAVWQERAGHARDFVAAMWNEQEGHFWTGTKLDGVTINRDVIPLDVMPWAVLAILDVADYVRGLAWADSHCAVTVTGHTGVDFDCGDLDGIWPEGTAQLAVAHHFAGVDLTKTQQYLDTLRSMQLAARNANGRAIVAASRDGLTTGFDWEYFSRPHVGATAWFIMAENGYNPYWHRWAEPIAIPQPPPPPDAGTNPQPSNSGGGGGSVTLMEILVGTLLLIVAYAMDFCRRRSAGTPKVDSRHSNS